VEASFSALMFSPWAVKYAWSVVSPAGAGAGTLVPFGSMTAARAGAGRLAAAAATRPRIAWASAGFARGSPSREVRNPPGFRENK